jgi:hypothetical protein
MMPCPETSPFAAEFRRVLLALSFTNFILDFECAMRANIMVGSKQRKVL